MASDAGFHFSVRPSGSSWAWETFAAGTRTRLDGGLAPSRAGAAAVAVRCIASRMTSDEGAGPGTGDMGGPALRGSSRGGARDAGFHAHEPIARPQ